MTILQQQGRILRSLEREILEYLSDDLSLLHNDLLLNQAGYTFFWGIDFSELFRYLYPVIDYLDASRSAQRHFFAKQYSIRYLIDTYQDVRMVLPGTLAEFQNSLANIDEKIRYLVGGVADYPLTVTGVDDPAEKIARAIEMIELPGEGGERLRNAVIQSAKRKVLTAEFQSGVRVFRQLMESGTIATMDPGVFSELTAGTEYSRLCAQISQDLLQLRPERSQANSFDAQNCALLVLLNRTMLPNRQVYVMVTDANIVRFERMVVDLNSPLPTLDYRLAMPMLRSLNYCLLRAYFFSGPGKQFEQIISEVASFRSFVNRARESVFGTDVYFLQQSNVLRKIQEVLNSLMELHAWGQLHEKLSLRIESHLNLESTDPWLLKGDAVAAKFKDSVQKTAEVYEDYQGLAKDVGEMQSVIAKITQDSRRSKTRTVTNKGFHVAYNPDYFTEGDAPVREQLIRLYSRMSSVDMFREEEEKVCAEADSLVSQYPRSPAARVAKAICLRWHDKNEEALNELEFADRIAGPNPDMELQKAIVYRNLSASNELAESQREMYLAQAQIISEQLLRLDTAKSRASFYQFAEHLLWRILKKKRPHILYDKTLRSEDLEVIRRAIDLCAEGIRKQAPIDSPSDRQVRDALVLDQAWYSALLNDPKQIRDAKNWASALDGPQLALNQRDTVAFVSMQSFRSKPSPDRLDELIKAINLYIRVLSEDPLLQSSREGLAIAMVLFQEHGGKLEVPKRESRTEKA